MVLIPKTHKGEGKNQLPKVLVSLHSNKYKVIAYWFKKINKIWGHERWFRGSGILPPLTPAQGNLTYKMNYLKKPTTFIFITHTVP